MSQPVAPSPALTLLDACAVVNLYATRVMDQILSTVDGTVSVVDIVEGEAQFVFRGGSGDDAKEREPVVLGSLIARQRLTVISTANEDELITYIDLTREVDAGEAMTAAVAIHRRGIVVTDDRKASRVLLGRGVPVRTSLDLVKTWSEHNAIAPHELLTVLLDLSQRGNYQPSSRHPLRSWWDAALGSR